MSGSDIYILAMPAIAAAAVLLTGGGLAVFLKRQSRDGKRVGATERSNRRAQGIVDKEQSGRVGQQTCLRKGLPWAFERGRRAVALASKTKAGFFAGLPDRRDRQGARA